MLELSGPRTRTPDRRRRTLTVAAVLGVVALVTACGSADPLDATPTSSVATTTTGPDSPYPDSIVVLGHSGATGANSDNRGLDVKANSWATGTNPEVNSIYLRVLELNPNVEGHNVNVALDGWRSTTCSDKPRRPSSSSPCRSCSSFRPSTTTSGATKPTRPTTSRFTTPSSTCWR